MTAILAEEEHPPQGQKPVRWWLLTTLPIATLADAQQAVRRYAMRWLVEMFHPDYPSSDGLYRGGRAA